MRSPARAWATLCGVLALTLLAVCLWATRYQYVGSGPILVRVNRWTGSAARLQRSVWQPITTPARAARAEQDPLDSLARSVGVDLSRDTADPYADIVNGRRPE